MGQRPGDQRARTRAAAGADRNALRLRPFDEVGDDQEIAGVIHAADDADLEGEPFAIGLRRLARGNAVRGDTLLQTLLGLAAHFLRLGAGPLAGVGGEARQDRLAHRWAERAAPRDLDGRGQRLRQIGEQHRHLGARLEAVICRQLAAVGFGDQAAFGDRQQRVMGLVVVGGGEIGLVGRDQRQPALIGQVNQRALDQAFGSHAVALQFDIEPVAEQAHQLVAARRRERALIAGKCLPERPQRAARQRNEMFGLALQPVELEMRDLLGRSLQEGPVN